MEFIFLAFQCFVVGFVYTELLITEGQLLYYPFKWLTNKLTFVKKVAMPDHAPDEVKSMEGYQYKVVYHISSKEHWLLKVLGGCPFCFTGQLTLWCLLYNELLMPRLDPYVAMLVALIAEMVFAVSFSILLVMILKKLYTRWSIQ